MHESFEAPGAIEKWARKKGFAITYTHIYKGEALPKTTAGFDFLIIMGGPQSPSTTLRECSYFNAQKEIQFIKQAYDKGKYLLGVCLGAQMIGEALGAKYDHSPNREIGVFDIELTDSAKNDPIFSTFPVKFPVGHWHGDMPGLTNESEILATSAGCPRQIIKYSPKVYGFQCHFEFTQETVEGMIKNCGHELKEYKNLPYIQKVDELRLNDYQKMNELLFKFLDYIITV